MITDGELSQSGGPGASGNSADGLLPGGKITLSLCIL